MSASAPSIRERVGSWISGNKRAEPISFVPEMNASYLGSGIEGNQPDAATLLRENKGVADISTRAIGNRLGTLNPQVKVTKQTSKGTTEDEILDDHILKALLDRPHPDFTRQQMMRLAGQYITSIGEAYWLKIRNGFEVPMYLQPMPPQNVEPIIRGAFIDAYAIRDAMGKVHEVPRSEVIRFWFPDPETIYTAEGYLGPNAVNHDAAAFASEHLRGQYQFDAMPQSVLKGSADAAGMSDAQWTRYQNDWFRKYSRRHGQKRGLPAALPTGWDLIQMAVSSGADITPLLEFWQSNQLMNFGVPASVLGRVVSGDRSSAETNQFVFDRHTIKPIAQLIQEALTLQLAPDFDEAIFVEFEDFVDDDKDFELKREGQDLALKVRSIQQIIRDREGDIEEAPWGELPVGSFADRPYTGEEPDDSFTLKPDDPSALGMPPAEDMPEPDDDDEPEPPRSRSMRADRARGIADAEWQRVVQRERKFRPRLQRAMRGLFEAQRKEAIRRLNAHPSVPDRSRVYIAPGELFTPEDWIRKFERSVEPIRKAAYLESALSALDVLAAVPGANGDFVFNDVVTSFLSREGALLVRWTSETTRSQLAEALAEGAAEGEGVSQIARRINEVFAGRRRNAETIARTELLKASQHAQLESFKQSGVVEEWRWNTNRDPEVRDSHAYAAGQVRAKGRFFDLVGPPDSDGVRSSEAAEAPGVGANGVPLSAANTINCRCFLTPVVDIG